MGGGLSLASRRKNRWKPFNGDHKIAVHGRCRTCLPAAAVTPMHLTPPFECVFSFASSEFHIVVTQYPNCDRACADDRICVTGKTDDHEVITGLGNLSVIDFPGPHTREAVACF